MSSARPKGGSARQKGASAFRAGANTRSAPSAAPAPTSSKSRSATTYPSKTTTPSSPMSKSATTYSSKTTTPSSPKSSSKSRSKTSTSSSRKGRTTDGKKKRSKDFHVPGATKQAPQLGLMEIVSKRFIEDVFQPKKEEYPGWKVLIVDKPSMKVLSSVVSMYDLVEQHISSVESLELKRAPFKNLIAMYVLAPTKSSIKRLMDDYADKSKILYGDAVFLYFLGPIPKKMLNELTQCKQLGKRIKGLAEINVDFLVREQRSFTLDTKDTFATIFATGTGMRSLEVKTAEKLVTLCVTLNEYPHVRFKQSSNVCTNIASIFQKRMDDYVGAHLNWWYHGSNSCPPGIAERDRSTLLLLDRSKDCLTPLMHDFNYQAVVNDLLKLEGDKITYKADSEEKDALLNDKDKLWVEMQGYHIAKVVNVVSTRIREMTSSSSSKMSGNQGNLSMGELAKVLKELPQYQEIMSKLSQHLSIATDCMDKLTKGNLVQLSELEQQLATGKDDEGGSRKLHEMMDEIESVLQSTKKPKDRLRLVLIVIISQGELSGSDRDRLLGAAQLGQKEVQLLENMTQLGIKAEGGAIPTEAKKGFLGSLRSSKTSPDDSDDEDPDFVSSRYVIPLKKILKDLVSNQLSTQEYPSVIPMPIVSNSTTGAVTSSARRRGKGGSEGNTKKTDKWGKKQEKDEPTHYEGGRNIVFMVGGLSYPELRVTRTVMQKTSREIIAGGTKFINPGEFISDLKTLVE